MELSYKACECGEFSLVRWVEFGLTWVGELPVKETWGLSLWSQSSRGGHTCPGPCSLLSILTTELGSAPGKVQSDSMCVLPTASGKLTVIP